MTYVKWGDRVYWRHTDTPLTVEPNPQFPPLPSSSLNRAEIGMIDRREFGPSDKLIEDIERQEDKDHSRRKKGAKKRAPKKKGWFS